MSAGRGDRGEHGRDLLRTPGTRFDDDPAVVDGRRAGRVDGCGEHVAALAVETRHDEARNGRPGRQPRGRHRFERRHRHDAPVSGERETLNGRDADANARERAGSGDDRKGVDLVEPAAVFAEPVEELARQTLAVRPRPVALASDALVVHAQRHAAARRRRFERENDHRRNVILRRCSALVRCRFHRNPFQ